MIVLPAIDILNNKCVRLTQGDYSNVTTYSDDPVSVAQTYLEAGCNYLHIIDLNGAKEGIFVNKELISKLVNLTNIKLQLGGGVRTMQDIQERIDMGVFEINIGTLALEEPEIIKKAVERFGSDRIVISVDVKNSTTMMRGWQENGTTDKNVFIDSMIEAGITKFICTDILKDGTLEKPNFDLYRKLRKDYPDAIITAAGGVSSLDDIRQLEATGVDYTIIGKALYEKRVSLQALTTYTSC